VFVVDAATGLTPADQEVAEALRLAGSPVVLAVNKADNEKLELQGAEFLRFGWLDSHAVSTLHGRGTGDLLDALVDALPAESAEELARKEREAAADEVGGSPSAPWLGMEAALEETTAASLSHEDGTALTETSGPDLGLDASVPRIAIVGRPNVGKSSLLNQLLGEDRAIVSDIPGTTRDVIDTALEWEGRSLRLVDTAGLRRRGKVASGPAAERYSALRALKAIGRADVCVLVLDARDGLAAQDAHVAGYVVDEGVGLILALNKWDLVEKDEKTFEQAVERIRRQAPFLHFAPVLAISALTGQRIGRVLDEAVKIAAERRRRVPTGQLNRVLSEAVSRHQPSAVKGRRPRFYYATQAAIEPPTFVLFASDADAVHFSYQRFLENRIREAFRFEGSPLRLIFRERTRVELEPRPRAPRRNAGSARRAGGAGGGRAAKAAARGSGPAGKRTTPKPGRRRT
jgi:GTP-binding protein